MSTAAVTLSGSEPATSATAPTPAASGWAAFRAGLLRPSLAALAGSILVCGAWSAGLMALLTPEWIGSPQGARMASGPHDRHLRVTSLALGFSRRASLDRPAVFLLGASDFREGLNSALALGRLLPPEVEVFDLYSGWQSVLDTAALVETFPPHLEGVAVVMVSPKRIAHGITYDIDFEDQPPFHRSFGFRSELREEIAAREGVKTSFRSRSLLLENYHFYLPRVPFLLSNLFGPPPAFANHDWTEASGKPPLSPERAALNRSELAKVLAGYEANRADSFWMLARIQELVEQRGGGLVLLEAPMSPAGYREVIGDELLARYRADVQAFAAEHGLDYWDTNPELGLDDDDFWDDQHLYSKRGRTRFTEALARRLLPLLGPTAETE